MTCERHGGNAGSIFCRECDLETIERESVITPTPERINEAHTLMTRSACGEGADHETLGYRHRVYMQSPDEECYICVLLRYLAAAKAELAQERERAEKNARDAERLQWLQENYAYVMGYPNGKDRGMAQIHDPTGTGNIRAAIDAAIAGEKK